MSRRSQSVHPHLLAAAVAAFGPIVLPAAADPSAWDAAVDGQWTDGANWSTAPEFPNNESPPGITYDATIDAAGVPYEVTFDSLTPVAVDSLTVNSADATLTLKSGTFSAATATLDAGRINFHGARIDGGVWTLNSGILRFSPQPTWFVNGAQLGWRVDIRKDEAIVFDSGAAWTGFGTFLEGDTHLYFADTRTLARRSIQIGGGAIHVGAPFPGASTQTPVLTIASDSSITGYGRIVDGDPGIDSKLVLDGALRLDRRAESLSLDVDAIENSGTIRADADDAILTIGADSLTSSGLVEAVNGASVEILGARPGAGFANSGTVRVATGGVVEILQQSPGAVFSNAGGAVVVVHSTSTVRLGGRIASDALGTLENVSGGTFEINADIDNTGRVLEFDQIDGRFDFVDGGIIRGGVIRPPADRDPLRFWGGVLADGAVYDGILPLRSGNLLIVDSGATWTALPSALGGARLAIADTRTLNDEDVYLRGGSIVVGADYPGVSTSEPVVTLGTTSIIRGWGRILDGDPASAGSTFINEGTIRPGENTMAKITIEPDVFVNRGLIEVARFESWFFGDEVAIPSGDVHNQGVIRAIDRGEIEILGPGQSDRFSNAGGRLEVATDDARIEVGGRMRSDELGMLDNAAGGELVLVGVIENSGRTLTTDGLSGLIALGKGSVIEGGTFLPPPGDDRFSLQGVCLDGVVWEGDFVVPNDLLRFDDSSLTLDGGSTWTGGFAEIQSFARLLVADTRTLHGEIFLDFASLVVGDPTKEGSPDAPVVTVGATSLVRGAGRIEAAASLDGRLENLGTIRGEPSGGRSLTIDQNVFVNQGLIEVASDTARVVVNAQEAANHGVVLAAGGGEVEFASTDTPLSSSGGLWLVADDASTIRLGGVITGSEFGEFDNAAGGQFEVTGTIENAGNDLVLGAGKGVLTLGFRDPDRWGVVRGGTIRLGGEGTGVRFIRGRLTEGALFEGPVLLSETDWLYLDLGGRWAATSEVHVGQFARVAIGDTRTISAADITLALGNLEVGIEGGSESEPVVSVAAGTRIHGNGFLSRGSRVSSSSIVTLVNEGVVRADPAEYSLVVNLDHLSNLGVLEAAGDGAVLQLSPVRLENSGVIRAADGGLVLIVGGSGSDWFSNGDGTVVVADAASAIRFQFDEMRSDRLGAFDNSAGGTLELRGVIDNRGQTFSAALSRGVVQLGAQQVSPLPGPVIIQGGTVIQTAGQGVLEFVDARLTDGAVVEGDLSLGEATRLVFSESNTWTGTRLTLDGEQYPGLLVLEAATTFDGREVVLDPGTIVLGPGAALTLGVDTEVRGSGRLGGRAVFPDESSISNHGTIRSDRPGESLDIRTATFENDGRVEADAGTLEISSWNITNRGTMRAINGGEIAIAPSGFPVLTVANLPGGRFVVGDASSTITLGGAWLAPEPGAWDNTAGGTLVLVGELQNTDHTLDLAQTGTLTLDGGTIRGGTVRPGSGGERLVPLDGTLSDGALLEGDLLIEEGHVLQFDSGADWSGTRATIAAAGTLRFLDERVLEGREIRLANGLLAFEPPSPVTSIPTIGEGTTIQGSGDVWVGNGPAGAFRTLKNLGTIRSADGAPSGELRLVCAEFINEGLLEVTESREIRLPINTTNRGTIRFTDVLDHTQVVLRSASIIHEAGVIEGRGTTGGFRLRGGTLSPASTAGPSAGHLELLSRLTLEGGTIAIDVGGREPGASHDLLTVSTFGAIDLSGGPLELRFIDGFEDAISPRDSFTVLQTVGSLTGMFANVVDGRIAAAGGHGDFAIELAEGGTAVVLRDFRASGPGGPSLADWRMAHFGTSENAGDAADLADPDKDRIPNLVEYAADRDPNDGGGMNGLAGILRVVVAPEDEPRVVLNLPAEALPDVTLTLECLGAQPGWQPIATRSAGAGWIGPAAPVGVALDPPEDGRAGFGFIVPETAGFGGGVVVRLRATSP